jgi:hypothetical protein
MELGEEEENGQRQEAELEALRSIYAPDEIWSSDDGRIWTAILSRKPRAELHLHLPLTYPSRDPPAAIVEAGWLPLESVSRLCTELGALHTDSAGLEQAFGWIAHAQQFVANELRQPPPAAVAALAPEGAGETVDVVAAVDDAKRVHAELAAAALATRRAAAPPIFSGEPLTDRKSTFQSHVARCSCAAEVQAALDELRSDRKIARATHNQYAWRLHDAERGAQLHDNDDDGESGAGAKLAELLELMKVNNLLVVVSRWYGGILLGSDRFRHIVSTARNAIEQAGILPEAAAAAGPPVTAPAPGGRRKGRGR